MATKVTVETVEGSIEFLYVDVVATQVLDVQQVEIAVAAATVRPDAVTTWENAVWLGDVGTSRTARVLLDGLLGRATYNIWVRITDSPEVPILAAGKLKVV